MNIDAVIKELDSLYEQNRNDLIEGFISGKIVEAMEEGDDGCVIVLLNEMVGYCRGVNLYDKAVAFADKALELIDSNGLSGTIHEATTLLNKANALRGAKRLLDSVKTYERVEKIYSELLDSDAFDFASLYNNLSLDYMELQDYGMAVSFLEKALVIAEKYQPERGFERAVTWTNLGNSLLHLDDASMDMMNKDEESCDAKKESICNAKADASTTQGNIKKAGEYLNLAKVYFDSINLRDTHYAAAIMGIAEIYERGGDFQQAVREYENGMVAINMGIGFTDYYYRMRDALDLCICKAVDNGVDITSVNGRYLSLKLWEKIQPELVERFADAMKRACVGLVGEGSECFGFDDFSSRDHDWGPAVCVFLEEADYKTYGKEMQLFYDEFVAENPIDGYVRGRLGDDLKGSVAKDASDGRVGIVCLDYFLEKHLGRGFAKILTESARNNYDPFSDHGNRDLDSIVLSVPELGLATVTNGILFEEGDGLFVKIRALLENGYPKHLKYLKLAQACALFSQNLQYNLRRMIFRQDVLSASAMLNAGLKQAYTIAYLLNDKYMPHDKWIVRGMADFEIAEEVVELSKKIMKEANTLFSRIEDIESAWELMLTEADLYSLIHSVDDLAAYLLAEMRRVLVLSESELMMKGNYLEDAAAEFSLLAGFADMDRKQLVDLVVSLEWNAFDKVINEGGRASCQNNPSTFGIMRKSQYNLWSHEMLVRYATDFNLALSMGRNLITEKYGRMEESTAPEKWNEIKDRFPVVSDEKKQVIESIVALQVSWMESFAADYPNMAGNARTIHTADDTPYDTSYETYLRGEMSTYSDTMLTLYGAFVAGKAQSGDNLAYDTMEQTALLYGYESLDAAEKALG